MLEKRPLSPPQINHVRAFLQEAADALKEQCRESGLTLRQGLEIKIRSLEVPNLNAKSHPTMGSTIASLRFFLGAVLHRKRGAESDGTPADIREDEAQFDDCVRRTLDTELSGPLKELLY